MYTTEYVVRRFSKTPLKHRMSKYLLEHLLEQESLLHNLVFVEARDNLPNTMFIAQAGTEGAAFELELGAVETEQVTLVNGRLVKEKHKTRDAWIHDPVEAIEALRGFEGVLHVQFEFAGPAPDWYQEAVVQTDAVSDSNVLPGFAAFVREQIDLALLGIITKHEIDEALRTRNKELFREKAPLYNQIRRSCFWKL